jgi:hypothetical protein
MSTVWSTTDEQRKKFLFNKIIKRYQINKNINENNYIEKYVNYLPKIIQNLEYSEATKEAIYYMITKFLEINGNKEAAKIYRQISFQYMIKNKNKEKNNEQNEKERINYRTNSYFLKILNDINYDNIQTYQEHQKYLLLSLLVLQPPLRTNFYLTSKFILSYKDDNKINNFIMLREKKPCFYIVNCDKVSNNKLFQKYNKIDIENENLNKLLLDSYSKYKRVYLFENENNQPISHPTLLNWLRSITQIEEVNIDIMRSSYINNFYENNMTYGKREQLAHKMRHKITTAQINYYKVNTTEEALEEIKDNSTDEKKDEPTDEKKDDSTDEPPNEEPDDKMNNPKFRKLKRDVLYNLNKGCNPRESTLKKYNIKYNTNTKQYE